jgi:hypothetical protein
LLVIRPALAQARKEILIPSSSMGMSLKRPRRMVPVIDPVS